MPSFDKFEESVAKRIDTIRDNMYSLPVYSESSRSSMKEAIYFVDDKGDRIDYEQSI